MLRTCKLILVQYGPYPVALTAGLLPKHSVQACHSLGLQGMQVPQPIHGSLLDWGEKRVSANSKTKHTEPLTSELISPLYKLSTPGLDPTILPGWGNVVRVTQGVILHAFPRRITDNGRDFIALSPLLLFRGRGIIAASSYSVCLSFLCFALDLIMSRH